MQHAVQRRNMLYCVATCCTASQHGVLRCNMPQYVVQRALGLLSPKSRPLNEGKESRSPATSERGLGLTAVARTPLGTVRRWHARKEELQQGAHEGRARGSARLLLLILIYIYITFPCTLRVMLAVQWGSRCVVGRLYCCTATVGYEQHSPRGSMLPEGAVAGLFSIHRVGPFALRRPTTARSSVRSKHRPASQAKHRPLSVAKPCRGRGVSPMTVPRYAAPRCRTLSSP